MLFGRDGGEDVFEERAFRNGSFNLFDVVENGFGHSIHVVALG